MHHSEEEQYQALESRHRRANAGQWYVPWRPIDWPDKLKELEERRETFEHCPPAPQTKESRFQVLVSMILAKNTDAELAYQVFLRLLALGLDADCMRCMKEEELCNLIKPVDSFRSKARALIEIGRRLLMAFDGDVPPDAKGLLQLPEVDEELVDRFIKVVWGDMEGLKITKARHIIANKLMLLRFPAPTPEKTKEGLESWIPRYLWPYLIRYLDGCANLAYH